MNRFQRERYRKSRLTRARESAEAVKKLGAWWRARKKDQLLQFRENGSDVTKLPDRQPQDVSAGSTPAPQDGAKHPAGGG